MGAKARRRVLVGAIRVRPRAQVRVKGRATILVDDVLTSGATSAACVVALKRAGATSVTIACFARVLEEGLALRRNDEAPETLEGSGRRVTNSNGCP